MTPNHQRTVGYLKAVATFTTDVTVCPHAACRKRGKCTGGPRGTIKRLGKPLCMHAAMRKWMDGQSKAKAAAKASRVERAREQQAFEDFNAPYLDQ
ncbi:MAG: hypothetical protein AAGG69_05740 [Pseudomonadota bacterium]